MSSIQGVSWASNVRVCSGATIQGNVKIGENCVVHPACQIVTDENSSVVIGENNIFEENVAILVSGGTHLTIGKGNIFEVGCTIDSAAAIGSGNKLLTKCTVGRDASMGNGCVVGVTATVGHREELGDLRRVYRYGEEIRQGDLPNGSAEANMEHTAGLLDFLRSKLPAFHSFLKPDGKGK